MTSLPIPTAAVTARTVEGAGPGRRRTTRR